MCNSHPLLNVIFVAFATPFFFVSCDNSFFDWVDEKGNILISYDTQRQYDDYIQSNLISTEVPYSSWTHETFICFNKPITDCFRQTLTNEDLTDGDQQQNMMTHFSEDGENEDKQQKKDAKQPENDKIKKDGRNENEKDVKKEDTKIHHLIIDSFTLKNSTDLNNIFTKDLRLLLLLMDEKLNIRNLFELFKNAKHLKTLFFFTNTTESVIEVSDSDDLSDFNKMESSLDYLYLCGTFNPSAALLIALLEPKFLSTKYLESEYDFAEFEHLGKFEEVELRGRNLRNSSSVFDFLHSHNVKKLGLAKSELKDIPSELKQLESSLQYLSLASNDLSSIDSASIFPQVTALLELDLRFCQLKSLSSHFFDEVPSLRSVSLSGNYLLQSSQQNNLNFLKNNILYLDLNLNPFSHVISVKYTSSELRQFLNPKPEGVFLDLSYTYFKRCKSDSKYIQPNITHLSIIDSVNCFKNVNFTNLERLEAIDASSNINAKKSSPIIGDEIDSFFKRITNVRVLLFRENHLQRGLVVKPNLFEKRFTSLEILDLSENNLRTIPLNLFQIHTLKNLNLSSNLIQKWDVTLVRNDSSAKHLIVDLSFNKIAWITPAMEHDFYNFKEINLRDNVLLCNEQLKRLLCAAERNYGSVKILNMKETTCNRLDRDESLTLEELKKRENCQRATTASLSSVTSMGPMVPIQSLWLMGTVLVCLLLYATWNWTNHVNFYTISKNLKFAASLTTFSKKKESFCCDFRYDVFVSYAGIDRDWVIDRLMPNLETESGIRICLHERDFQIGMGIMENIVDCIDKSQCLLLVISKSFVKSKWCQFEMNLGQYFTIESNKPHLILVLLEEIPKNVRPKVLSYLMRTRTYIEWPKSAQDNNEAEFFQRLTKALNDSKVS